MTGRKQALELYRKLLQSSSQLRYTSPEWFVKRVRSEFEYSRTLTDQKMIDLQFEKAEFYLEKRPLV